MKPATVTGDRVQRVLKTDGAIFEWCDCNKTVVFPPVRHVQEACVSSLHDEGKLQVREQLCFLPPRRKWTTTTPQPPR